MRAVFTQEFELLMSISLPLHYLGIGMYGLSIDGQFAEGIHRKTRPFTNSLLSRLRWCFCAYSTVNRFLYNK